MAYFYFLVSFVLDVLFYIFLGYSLFQCMYTLSSDQIRVISLSSTLNLCHVFVMRTFKSLSSSYFETLYYKSELHG